MKGEVREEKLQGLEARVFQHELDHLDGILFDTKVGPASLDWAKQKRKKKLRHSFD
jgi:peptide deformylase